MSVNYLAVNVTMIILRANIDDWRMCMHIFSFFRFDMESEIFAISKDLMLGPGEDLFDHIANCLANFAKKRGLDKEVRTVCTGMYTKNRLRALK